IPFKLGQWKNWDVFINHYANQVDIPKDLSSKMLPSSSPKKSIKSTKKGIQKVVSPIKSPTLVSAISPLRSANEDSSVPTVSIYQRSPSKRRVKVTPYFGSRVFH